MPEKVRRILRRFNFIQYLQDIKGHSTSMRQAPQHVRNQRFLGLRRKNRRNFGGRSRPNWRSASLSGQPICTDNASPIQPRHLRKSLTTWRSDNRHNAYVSQSLLDMVIRPALKPTLRVQVGTACDTVAKNSACHRSCSVPARDGKQPW